MRSLPRNQYHQAKACRCCCAHNNKHAGVAIKPISLSKSTPLLPFYSANITCPNHAVVPMHIISNMQLLLCNQYHSAKACSRCHAHTISNMQPLPCNQYRSAKACNCCHAYDTKHELLLCNQYHSAQIYSYYHAYKTKHAIVATQPMSLKLNVQLLPYAQYHTCNCCHANNVTQYNIIRILDMYIIMLPSHNCNSKFSWSSICNFYKINQNHRLFRHENLLMALLSIDRA